MNEPVQAQLRRVLLRLRRELDEDLERVLGLRALRARREELEYYLEDLDRQLERLREAAVITLVGATGAGKSTLLNALVQSEIAVEGEDRPTTVRPVIYAPADADLSALLADLPGAEPQVVCYDPRRSGGPWTEQVLIDAPDINSVAAEHREVVRVLADRSDVLLVLVHHQSLVEEASVSFVDEFAGRRSLIFALGRADELGEEARAALLADLGRLARERWNAPEAPVLALSPRAAKSQPETSGWSELCAALRELVARGVLGGVRRHNALGTAGRLGRLVAELGEPVAEDLTELPGEVERGCADLGRRVLGEVDSRLRLRRADLEAELWGQAARRWDGPGGWVLRAGGLGGLGLGAGAFLMRRNPALAAGAAVGGLAVDKARQVARSSRLEGSGSLLPGEDQLGSQYTEALGPARLRAARLTGEAASLGVPTREEAAERVGAAVEEAWAGVLERDLLAAAERCVPWWVRWPLDLPIYALGGWVAYRAVVGFFDAQYLGFDFLVNAFLVALAYLFLVRFGMRRSLAWRVRGLLEGVRSGVEAGLAGWAERGGQAARESAAEPAGALARLADLEGCWRRALVAAREDGDPR